MRLFCIAIVLLAGLAFAAGGLAAPPADLALVVAVTGVAEPLAVRHAGDGSNRLFIAGRNGVIRVRLPGQSVPLATPFLSLVANPPPRGLSFAGEGGTLGLAFHPAYESNGFFYVSYSDAQDGTSVVRYRATSGGSNVADPASAQLVIRVARDESFHQGGDIHFGPDGYLYIARGAGGAQAGARSQTLRPAQIVSGGSPCASSPAFTNGGGNPNSRALQGKILRIDVDAGTAAGGNELCASAADGSANYAIPPANPFAGSAGVAGNCDEIFHYGLRNPFRFSFDRATGAMFIGDVGESTMEEIDFSPPGSPGAINFGWIGCEGTGGSCAGTTLPILAYTHTANAGVCASVTGGFRYRGAIGGFGGTYVYADYCSGKIHFATDESGSWTTSQWQDGPDLQFASFGEDEAGELYLAELGGDRVLRFSSAQSGVIFANGFEPAP
jgi:glucose/arabinose dehydrogenase